MKQLNKSNQYHLSKNLINFHAYQLGASLYMPATRSDLWQVISRKKLENLNSVIICLEDAVNEADIPQAMTNIHQLLKHWSETQLSFNHRPLVFIRPRHTDMLKKLSHTPHIDLIDGFVLPKVDLESLQNWRLACQNLPIHHVLMPTLETKLIFNHQHNQDLAIALMEAFYQSIIALRIGGNDLLSCLRLRRPANMTLYQTPIGTVIHQLLGCFVPNGFYLTAPVFEYFDKVQLFSEELQQDIALGFVGKTIIHPSQIAIVQQALQVSSDELSQANAILADNAPAVFKYNHTMLEPATHRTWANEIIQRFKIFGKNNH